MPFLAPVVGAIFSGGFITQLLVGTALSFGASLLQQALAPKPQRQVAKDPGVSLDIQIGSSSPLSFFVGIGATAGHRVYAGSWGNEGETPNAYFADVLEISNAPIDGLNNVYVEGELADVLWGEAHPDYGFPIAQGRRGGADYLWVKFYRGDQAVADPYLRAKFGSHPSRPYDAGRVGNGTAYAIVTTRYNRENWNGRPPKMLFEVRGIRCYDIRKDSTVGGSGSHRRDNPATWEFSKNPYVIAFNAAFMGVYVGSEWLWGLQNLPASRLPASAWIAAMNEADRASWGGVAQFEIGGEITVDMQPADFLDEVAASSLGRFIESAASYKPRCGLPGASVWSFGEGELLITDARTFNPFPGLEQTVNYVEISYSEPAEAWGSKPAPEATDAAYITADGNRKLPKGLNLRLVSRNEQAQRLGWSYLRDGRRFRTFTGTFHPIAWQLEPGDVIEGTILSEGYDGKTFEILEMSGRRNFAQTMTIREVDPDDFDPPESAYQDWSVGPIQTIYPPSQPATGVSFAPYTLYDNSANARRPGIEAFYQGGMDDVRYFAVQVRRPGDTLPFFENLTLAYRVDVIGEASQPIFSQSFAANMDVEVRGKYVPFTSRETAWSSWMAVKLPNVKLGADDIDISFAEIAAEIIPELRWLSINLKDALDNFERLGSLLSEQDLANYDDKLALRRELAVTADGLTASFNEIIEVAIGPGGAITQKLEALYAAMGGSTAQVLVRYAAESSPVGVEATWGLQVSTDDGETFGSAAFLVQVKDGESQIVLGADRTIVSNADGSEVFALFDENGLMVRDITASLARSISGNTFINFTTGAVRFSTS